MDAYPARERGLDSGRVFDLVNRIPPPSESHSGACQLRAGPRRNVGVGLECGNLVRLSRYVPFVATDRGGLSRGTIAASKNPRELGNRGQMDTLRPLCSPPTRVGAACIAKTE